MTHRAFVRRTLPLLLPASDARIYGVPNAGFWYDLGLMLGIGGFSSGIFASKGRKD